MTKQARLLRKPELLLRGSYFELTRTCSKPNCHCATGQPHTTPALSYRADGRTKILTPRVEDIAEVKAALARYQAARDELDARAAAGLEQLRARVVARRQARR